MQSAQNAETNRGAEYDYKTPRACQPPNDMIFHWPFMLRVVE